MAWTSVYALLLSLALASAIVIDEVLLSHRLHRPGPGVRQVLATSAIVVVGVGAAALQLRAPADAVPVVDVEVANIGNAKTTAFLPWEALVPVPPLNGDFWNDDLVEQGAATIVLGSGLVMAIAWSIRRRPAALWMWTAGTILVLSFTHLLFPNLSLRHKGHLFILLVATMWLAPSF